MSLEVRFYHLERQNLGQVLPSLLNKAYQTDRKILVKAPDEQEAQRLSDHLWTYNPNSFLPHGTKKDGQAESQPIYLTAANENPNEADVIILTHGSEHAELEHFSLCCDIFDGRNEDAVSAARQRWKTYKDAGYKVTYWQQGPKGWEKKSG